MLTITATDSTALQQSFDWPQTRADIQMNSVDYGAALPPAIWALPNISMSMTEKGVLNHLLWRMGKGQTFAYPSYPTMAKFLGMDERTIMRAIDKLVENGYLRKKRGSGRLSNCYFFTFRLRTCPAKLGENKTPPGLCDLIPATGISACPYCTDPNNPCAVLQHWNTSENTANRGANRGANSHNPLSPNGLVTANNCEQGCEHPDYP